MYTERAYTHIFTDNNQAVSQRLGFEKECGVERLRMNICMVGGMVYHDVLWYLSPWRAIGMDLSAEFMLRTTHAYAGRIANRVPLSPARLTFVRLHGIDS